MSGLSDQDHGALAAEFYDFVHPDGGSRDIDFYVGLARELGGPVLEIGCGTGRVLIPTAREGIEIVGLDNSEAMLLNCEKKLLREAAEVRARVQLERGDMRDFDLGRAFGLITMPFRPFHSMITIDEQLSCLASISTHLTEGGRLAFDLFTPGLGLLAEDKPGERQQEEPWMMPDGRRVVRSHLLGSHDLSNQLQDVRLIYDITHVDRRIEHLEHAFRFRYFFRLEVEHLLVRSGFEVEHLYCDFDKSPVGSRNPGELIFVARKT